MVLDSIFLLTSGGETEPDGGGADLFIANDLEMRLKCLWRHNTPKANLSLVGESHAREARA